MILNAVKLPKYKNSAEKKTVTPPLPPKVIIGLSQNIGAHCEPIVKKGDRVLTGQIIADDTSANLSVPIHASVSGTVEDFTQYTDIRGKTTQAIIIATDSLQENHPGLAPPVVTDRVSFLKAVRASGSVGLGGAGFPTYAKLTLDKASKVPVDTLIINGAECEPYITGDYRGIMENPSGVIDGTKQILKYLDIPRAVIGIEKDKPKAIKIVKELCEKTENITVQELPTQYPQGAEKILIYQITGKPVMEGELPLHSGCVVLNISTVIFLSEYMRTGVPLITRRVTIDGDIVNSAKNAFLPVGTPLEYIIKIADLRKPPDRIIFGGPMMGSSVYDMNTPVTKTTGAVLFFADSKKAYNAESACIRCGKCIHVCSVNLNPYEMNIAYDNKNVDLLKKLRVNLCMNCGSCSFICPAKRNISEKNQLAKQLK
ncbi:MAG: RnfABCDGE type electron transport complex subunit C [Oscillospiraceae bacterium]|nr:RnfABCDGE type electron transport complex subunit C [Oscillospiraceae bacterium]